jgi:hypothetical protein
MTNRWDPASVRRSATGGSILGGMQRTVSRGSMQFRVLGPLEVSMAGDPIPLGGPKQRAVLAHLVLRANQLVPDVYTISVGSERPQEKAPGPSAASAHLVSRVTC